MFSIVILTLNEARDLPACLASVRGVSDDIVVLDSGSTDATCEIAHADGARIFARAFDDFAGQRNFAQAHVPFRHEWIFHLDADERMTPELAAECAANTADEAIDGYMVAPKMFFGGRWIPHSTDYPAYQARFVRRRFRFVQVGHGQREHPDMRLGTLRSSYLHQLDTGGEAEWLEKHRRYAAAEAKEHAQNLPAFSSLQLFSPDRLRRRRALKALSYRLPLRPTLRFFYQYVLRRGFLDGAAGFRYCQLLATYERFAVEALHNQTRRQ